MPVTTTKHDPAAGGPAGGRLPARLKRPSRVRKAGRARAFIIGVLKKPVLQPDTVMICESCELTGGPFAPGEAAHLLAVHQQLHHGAVSLHRPPLPPPVTG